MERVDYDDFFVPDNFIYDQVIEILEDNSIVNLGVGLPQYFGVYCKQRSEKNITFTNEIGLFGGAPAISSFGFFLNTDCIMTQKDMMNLYEGQGLDACVCGALFVDKSGKVDVLKTENKIFGLGGFNHVTQTAKTVIFIFEEKDRKGNSKIIDKVQNVCFDPEYSNAKNVYYITNKCVYKLIDKKLTLIKERN